MKFTLTPDEAQATAKVVHAHLRKRHFNVDIEQAVADGVPIPTLKAEANGLTLAVEAQKHPEITVAVREIVNWANQIRLYGHVYVATDIDASVSVRVITELKALGVGLMLVNGNEVSVSHDARNPALVVTPDPTLALGRCKAEVKDAVRRFNDGDRKAALRDMCELVERETDKLCRKLARKPWFNIDEPAAEAMKWANQIEVVAAKDRYLDGREAVVSSPLKSDLGSFSGARNLVDHKARTKREERARERQFAERMMMGPRLAAELLAAQRRVKG